jgi:hypothetical protein
VSWLRNPWLGAVVALAALALQARIETPLSALAIGAPFAFVMWVAWCFGPRMAASQGGAMATKPADLFPKVVAVSVVALGIAWFAYMTYGLFTGRGIIGWLNAVQAARDGKFSTKLSFIVALFYLLCAGGLLALVTAWLGHDGASPPGAAGGAGAASAPLRATKASAAAPAAQPARDPVVVVLWALAGLAVACWVIGYPVYLWIAAEHRADAQARYTSVQLSAATVAWPQDAHVSLDGRPQRDHVMVLKEGNHARKTYFVPVTGASWSTSQPVSAVLTFDAEVPPPLDQPILGRTRTDTLPLAAIEAFARSGVKVDPAHRLVDLVPSRQGQVQDRSDEDHQMFLIGASFGSALCLLGALMLWLVSKFRRVRTRPG